MSVAENLERELPYLRRYSRAVTGSGPRGDATVETVLRELVANLPAEIDRVGIFRMLDQHLSTLSTEDTDIAVLSTDSRRALLLTALEGFSPSDAAKIMRQDTASVQSLVAAADQELESSLATEVFIIEDEPLVAAHIAQIASSMGHLVVGQAITRDSAVAACRTLPPGLILADVQLADGTSGIEAVADITENRDIPVVFITAYPQRLLSGGQGEPAFLIPKPFRPDMVRAVISQALIRAQAGAAGKK